MALMMTDSIRTKAVVYTIAIVVLTSVISALGFSLLSISQTRRDNQRVLNTALISFQRHFAEIPGTVDRQFATFMNEKTLAIQTLQTVQMGWHLEIGLSFAGTFHSYEELLIKSGILDSFAFYYAPRFQGDEKLALYYTRNLGSLVLVEDNVHYKRLAFGRKAIDNPGLFPGHFTPSQAYALVREGQALFLRVESTYTADPAGTQTPVHIGSFLFKKQIGANLAARDKEMGVNYALYDARGRFGAGINTMPDLDTGTAAFSDSQILELTDTKGCRYDSLLMPLVYKGDTAGYLSVNIPRAATYTKIRETVTVLALISLAIVLGMALLSWFGVTRFTRPILELTQAAAEIARGNLNQDIRIQGRGELGILAQSFTAMRDAVRQKMEEIQIAEEKYRSIFENAPGGIFQTAPNGEILTVNHAFATMLGFGSAREMLDQVHTIQSDVYVDAKDRDRYKTMMLEKGTIKGFETRFRRKDATAIEVTISSHLVRNEAGDIRYFEGIAEDISERRRVEKLRIEKEAAEAAARTKSDFLANMSHEIRTPMNAIIGLTYLALNTRLAPKAYEYLKNIETASHSLLRIINDILDFSKIEAGKLKMETIAFSLDEVLTSLSSSISLRANEKDIEFLISRNQDVPNFLVGDPLRLGQVLTNLCTNAVKFTDTGEILVRIRVKDDALPGPADHVCLEFSVRDTGIGLSRAEQGRLFRRFTQADASFTRKYGGTGLGLTISKRLVELMDGKISVASQKGRGSTFTFTARLGVQTGAKDRERVLPEDLTRMKVLIVDDNPSSRTIFEEMLAGYTRISQAASAEEALAELRAGMASQDPYDLVFMDWKMPGMDGIQAIREINRDVVLAKQKPAVILVTAYGRQEIMEKAKTIGADGFLIKPVNASMLFDVIMDVFGIPRPSAEPSPEDQEVDELALAGVAGARVLLVEDNEINQKVATELLARANLRVSIAANGLECIKMADNCSFDLIFMDIQMPGMDGYEATRILRTKKPPVPIVAMTAHAMAGEREKCLQAGMDDYIPKPIDPAALYATLIKWIRPGEAFRADEAKGTESPVLECREPACLPGDLPGIEIKTGLMRVGGNPQLYRELLISFKAKYRELGRDLARELDGLDYKTAGRRVHTVKGMAGNLGATGLYHAAMDLESGIRKQTSQAQPPLLPPLLNRFKAALDEVINGLAGLEEGPDIPISDVDPPKPTDDIDTQKLASMLNILAQQLESDYIAATETIEALAPDLDRSAFEPLFSDLKAQVAAFDTQAAQQTLSELRETVCGTQEN